jgi:hypothetical protein
MHMRRGAAPQRWQWVPIVVALLLVVVIAGGPVHAGCLEEQLERGVTTLYRCDERVPKTIPGNIGEYTNVTVM